MNLNPVIYRRIDEIHEIELSSVCNLACVYCPHPDLLRPKAHMSEAVFERTLEHVAFYCAKGTQGEVALTGIGEAILHPQFCEWVPRVRAVVGARPITLSTNGVALAPAQVTTLRDYGVHVFVSLHRPEVAGRAVRQLAEAGVRTTINHAFVDSALDWAGQVAWHVSAPQGECQYLRRGWAVVRQDGVVVACCMDAHDLYPLGFVGDRVGSLRTQVTKLCNTCNLCPPVAFSGVLT